MTPPGGGQDDRELKARLERLSGALESKRESSKEQARVEDGASVTRTGQAMSLGFRVLSEFVAGILVGSLIGWQIDVWFNTTPFGLVVFLTLGTAAGFWNVYRIAAATGSR